MNAPLLVVLCALGGAFACAQPESGAGLVGAPLEQVPGAGAPVAPVLGPAPPLCHVQLDCPGDIPDEPKIDCEMTIWVDDGDVEFDGFAGVEVRGRSSYFAPKRQYGIELRDSQGGERDVDLLGMGAESDWVLNGTYYDRSLVRTALGFELFQSIGGPERYAPQAALCDLELDGVWLGVFTLTERIKRAAARVDIPADTGDGSNFVLKLHDEDWLVENRGGEGGWKLVYPRADRIRDSSLAGVASWMERWYSAVDAGDMPAVWELVDREALIDFILFEELMRDVDAYRSSVHAWRGADQRVHFAPWDLDLTVGQPDVDGNDSPTGWVAHRPPWVAAAVQDPTFRADLAARWVALRGGPWSDAIIAARVDRLQLTMGDAAAENFDVWPIEDVAYPFGDTYEVADMADEDAHLRLWLDERLGWMDAEISGW